jgi:glutamate--cysteine ligase catalytic subunit
MGLLTVGKPLSSAETKGKAAYVREKGITQFLHTWNRVKDIKDDELRFGDEVESGVFVVDNINKTVKLSIRSAQVFKI